MQEANTSNLAELVDKLATQHQEKEVDSAVLWQAIRNAVSPRLLVDNLAEALRTSAQETEGILQKSGFSDVVALARLQSAPKDEGAKGDQGGVAPCSNPSALDPFPDLFHMTARPGFTEPAPFSNGARDEFDAYARAIAAGSASDEFVRLYRGGVTQYFQEFMSSDAPKIDAFLRAHFPGTRPRYLVSTGIGANEMFLYFPASIYNQDRGRGPLWLTINSPRRLPDLPDDATVDNTLFLEFSRSGVTEETLKTHEYTPRTAHRIVFANQGPLREIGERDHNLILELPDQVSGRFGRNVTPILLAPMYVTGLDVASFWKDIQTAVETFDLRNPDSLPMAAAKYMFLYQEGRKRNLIYLGCNDEHLRCLSDEFVQFWNEGVNKGGNDLLMSNFFGLPRDSHMNVEGILGNRNSKLGLFLLRSNMRFAPRNAMVSTAIDPINPSHAGLQFGDEEVILAFANYERFSEIMPSLLVEVPGAPTLRHAAILGQLFTDITYLYSRLKHIDPGSNPEVKAVRMRSANLLAEVAERIRAGQPIERAVRP